MAQEGSTAPPSTEVTTFVQGLLSQMQNRFNSMSDSIITKIDDLGARIDELEKGMQEIVQQAGEQIGEGKSSVTPGGNK